MRNHRVSCRCVIDVMLLGYVCCTGLIESNSNHCFFTVLPSASTRVSHTLVAAVSHPLEFQNQGAKRPNLQSVSCMSCRYECGMTVPTLCLTLERWMGFRQAGCSQSLVASMSCVFFSFPWRRCLWGCDL